jgi:hypothetical protein
MSGLRPERDGTSPASPAPWRVSPSGAALEFCGGLFGWDFEDVMPQRSETRHFVARLRGRDVAAIGSVPEGAPEKAM